MKTLVIGLDSAAPDLLFGDESLTNFRRLMEGGCYGRLESVIPPISLPAWICMATSQDPGSLGVYGFRNRTDYSYDRMDLVTPGSVQDLTIWDQIAREGKRANIIGLPPSYPPRKTNGISVGCFLTPDTDTAMYTCPSTIKDEIAGLVGAYPVDVKGFRTDNKSWLKDEVYGMSRKHFAVVRHYLQNSEWDYFQFVEIGLDRLQHGFWKYHDPQHILHEPGNPYEEVIRDYYRYLDDELGSIFEVLTEDTTILVLSTYGAQRSDGGFCINEWLVNEGLLVLNEYPNQITPFGNLNVNWEKTKVWSEGGYSPRVFFNVKGREPQGAIDRADYEELRDQVKTKLEATVDDKGGSMGTMVFKPEEIYKHVRGEAPDLITNFGGHWRSIGSVGRQSLHVEKNEIGSDDCNHSQFGSFILASSNNPLSGEVEGAHVLDIAPTLLQLGGYDIPASMQGNSLAAGSVVAGDESSVSANAEDLIRERLSGLGYI